MGVNADLCHPAPIAGASGARSRAGAAIKHLAAPRQKAHGLARSATIKHEARANGRACEIWARPGGGSKNERDGLRRTCEMKCCLVVRRWRRQIASNERGGYVV